jgi:hypothetical protein
MTLSELTNDPKAMSKFMGWEWEGSTITYSHTRTVYELSAEEIFAQRWSTYIESIKKPAKAQTHLQMRHECLVKGLGLKGKPSVASVAERIKKAIETRPDLYSEFEAKK